MNRTLGAARKILSEYRYELKVQRVNPFFLHICTTSSQNVFFSCRQLSLYWSGWRCGAARWPPFTWAWRTNRARLVFPSIWTARATTMNWLLCAAMPRPSTIWRCFISRDWAVWPPRRLRRAACWPRPRQMGSRRRAAPWAFRIGQVHRGRLMLLRPPLNKKKSAEQ